MGATSNVNPLPSDLVALLDSIDPDAYGAGTETTAWISMSEFYQAMATVQVGTTAATSTVDAKVQQATDSSGTSAKDITGKAITQLTAAGSDDDKQAIINIFADDLDIDNDFDHIQFSITTAVAASDSSGLLQGMGKRHGPASKGNASSVDEIVT